MEPGEHGRIAERSAGGKHYASTYVRDSDGKRRRVERSSRKSPEDARRLLQRGLSDRHAPLKSQLVTEKTTLAELFDLWIGGRVDSGELKAQSARVYRDVWRLHGVDQLGDLRVRELPTSRAHAHIQAVGAVAPSAGTHIRVVLSGMFALAVRFDVLAVNPITGTSTVKGRRKPARAVTPDEFVRIRAALAAYAAGQPSRGGPKPGRLLPAYVELLVASGARPAEVLGIGWQDVDLLADPPVARINGQVLDHDRIPGEPAHRVDYRKHDAPELTVVLPRFGVEALTVLVGESGGVAGPVFANRAGGWMSLANMRRSLRAALAPHEDLRWVTPHSFRRTVGTVVRDALGVEAAQHQLGHRDLSTTERHYVERRSVGPDARAALDKFAGQ